VLEKDTSLRGVRDGRYRVLTWKDEMITEYKNKTGIMIVQNERNVMQKPKPKQRMKQATETVCVKKQRKTPTPPTTHMGRKDTLSENLQPLKMHTQVPRPSSSSTPIPRVIHTHSKIRRSTRIHADAHRLVLDAPEEPRHLAQLLPADHRVFVPDPQGVADAFHLDAQVHAARVVRRER
jgi:hypothetical protein